MTVSWTEKQDAIKAAVTKCLKLDTVGTVELADGSFLNQDAVSWEHNRDAARMTTGYWCDLRLGVVRTNGRDESRPEFVAGATPALSGLRYTYGGQRTFTVTCTVGSDDQSGPRVSVTELCGYIRTRIRRHDVKDILCNADVCLATIAPTVNIDYIDDGVMYSQAIIELTFNTAEEDLPVAEGALVPYINEAEGQGVPGEDLENASFHAGPVDV